MSHNWVDDLIKLDGHDDPRLAPLVDSLGEYTGAMLTDDMGLEEEFFLHNGDLEIDSPIEAAIVRLAARSQNTAVLVVNGNLRVHGTLSDEPNGGYLGIVVTGDLRCKHLPTHYVAIGVGGDLHVDGLFTSCIAHGLIAVDGVAHAGFEDADDESYDIRWAPDTIHLGPLRDFLREGIELLKCIDAGENPFVIPFEEALVISRGEHDAEEKRQAIMADTVEKNLKGTSSPTFTAEGLRAENLPLSVFERKELEVLRFPLGGVLAHNVRFLPNLRTIEGGKGLELPSALGMVTSLEELRTPDSVPPPSTRNLARLRVLHCRLDEASFDVIAGLVSLIELQLHVADEIHRLPDLLKLISLQTLQLCVSPVRNNDELLSTLSLPPSITHLEVTGLPLAPQIQEAVADRFGVTPTLAYPFTVP